MINVLPISVHYQADYFDSSTSKWKFPGKSKHKPTDMNDIKLSRYM